jgi:hypothetical protein
VADPWFLETEAIEDRHLRDIVEDIRAIAPQWKVLGVLPEDTQAWVYNDSSPRWIMLSIDVVVGNAILATLRLDLDNRGFRGGWSPADLSWDEGVFAVEAGVDLSLDASWEGVHGSAVKTISAWVERCLRSRGGNE